MRSKLEEACEARPSIAQFETIGTSEEGRPIAGVVLGKGPQTVSIVAGNHADEPVGPETLRSLVVSVLENPDAFEGLLEQFTFRIVPHTNPDGEARNRPWIEAWPDMQAYLRHVERDLPGRDLEFGFPSMRPENEAVASFLELHAPFALHASLHGMSVSEGALLLINRPWAYRSEKLQKEYRKAAIDAGLRMHDHNRKGEKGFFWIAPGYQTTPRGEAMRSYFRSIGDPDMADRFHDSSMEMVMGWGGDPLCLVTELPLWVLVDGPAEEPPPTNPHRPMRYEAFREQFADLRHQDLTQSDASPSDLLGDFELEPLDPAVAMRLQLTVLSLALETVAED
ncbi:M14 family zinc carboxypeptidase [Longibacter salinarum]|uniref:M14 family zinc carboxypeptidase n=1 Tax=Longibacter salinarum TaxID=1850348 RepID=UPI001FE69393|nr:M14 family zinc carboxypeptidase [Longibacter salinarum]